MSNQQKLVRKFKNISRVLTRCQNMQVIFKGNTAYHLEGKIVLPIGDFSNDDFITMSVGYCDHELGHENYTDNAFYVKAYAESKFLKSLLNSLDDAHQEARLMAEFKGCKTSLRKIVELCKTKGLFAKPTDKTPVKHILKAWVLYGARSANDQPLNDYFQLADVLVKQQFGDDFYNDLHAIFSPAVMHTINTTEKCYLVAKQIFDLFMEWVEQQDEGSDSDDADGSDDSDDSQSDSDDADGSDDSDDSQSDSDDADGSEDSDDSQSDSDDADGSEDSDAGRNGKTSCKSSLLASIEVDDELDFHDCLRNEIEAMAGEFDENSIQALPVIYDDFLSINKHGDTWASDTHKLVAKLKSPLKRIFNDQNFYKKSLNKKGANICSSRLSSVVTGNSRIFEKETIGRSPNSAVALLVDKSGSMYNEDMLMANNVSYSMSAALDAIKGVSNMCAYYPTHQYKNESYTDDSLGIVKHFDQKAKAEQFRFEGYGGTPTAQAVTSALSFLVNRAEPRKLLFVITDGAADNALELKSVIDDALMLGVRVFGIGINCHVSGFENADFSVIHSEHELVNALTIGLKHAFK